MAFLSVFPDKLPSGESRCTATLLTPNTGRNQRSGYVVFTAMDKVLKRKITQKAKGLFIELDNIPEDNKYVLPSEGGTLQIAGVTNAASVSMSSSAGGDFATGVSSVAFSAGEEVIDGGDDLFRDFRPSGDPGASEQYPFRLSATVHGHEGSSEKSQYACISGDTKNSQYFYLKQLAASMFIRPVGSVPSSITVPSDGLKSLSVAARANLTSLSWKSDSGSDWAYKIPMQANVEITGNVSGSSASLEVSTSDTYVQVPYPIGRKESYSCTLNIQKFPANTGRSKKSGLWKFGDSSVYIGFNIVQDGAPDFCELQQAINDVSVSWSMPMTISIKGRGNTIGIYLTSDNSTGTNQIKDAKMLINGSAISEWSPDNIEPGNIYSWRGEEAAYDWEIQIPLPTRTGISPIISAKINIGYITDSRVIPLQSFTIKRS